MQVRGNMAPGELSVLKELEFSKIELSAECHQLTNFFSSLSYEYAETRILTYLHTS